VLQLVPEEEESPVALSNHRGVGLESCCPRTSNGTVLGNKQRVAELD
jgi:hypothetical protein